MSILTWALGVEPHTIVTGIANDEHGLRVYVGPRVRGIYCIITGPDEIAEMRRAWGNNMQQIIIPVPPADALYQDTEES